MTLRSLLQFKDDYEKNFMFMASSVETRLRSQITVLQKTNMNEKRTLTLGYDEYYSEHCYKNREVSTLFTVQIQVSHYPSEYHLNDSFIRSFNICTE